MAVHLCLNTPVWVLVSDCKMNSVSRFFGMESQLKHVSLRLSIAGLPLHIHELAVLQAGIVSSPVVSEALLKHAPLKMLCCCVESLFFTAAH